MSERKMKRKLAATGVALILLSIIAGAWATGSILSAPANEPVGNLPPDLVGRSVEFTSASGTTIHGWFIPGKQGVGAIVLMHGVRANRLSMVDRARLLSRAGYSVLLFDFQAHGESSGDHITFGYLESRDAQAALSYLRTIAPNERVGVIGVSMGGAAALLASPPLDVNAMVLEMVYPAINQAISNRLTIRLGKWSSILTPLLTWQLKPRLGIKAADLRPIDRVGKITAPKFFIAGAEDQYTTIDESRQMFNSASEPKEFWVVEGAKHVDLFAAAKDEYEHRVLSFLAKYLGKPPTSSKF